MLLSGCRALSGSPVPPGEGPSSLAGMQSPTWPGPANLTLLKPLTGVLSRASLSFPLPRDPSQISLFLCSFSSLEAPVTARKVCSRPHVGLGILGPCVCYGYTPAAMAHVHVWILCEQTCHMPMCPPPQRGPAGSGASQVCLDFPKPQREQALQFRKSPWQPTGPRAIFCNQCWDLAARWASWRFVPYDGRLGRGLLSRLPLFSCPPLPHPQGGRAARTGQRGFEKGLP